MPDCHKIITKTCLWVEDRIRQCVSSRDESLKTCSSYQDNGYSQCTEWRDDGYSTCTAWDQQCCTWIPCSWLCKVVTWVCLGWVWVSNLVCIAAIWISNIVCVAWIWITYSVCVAWVTVVSYTCIVIAWSAYWICKSPEAAMNAWLWTQLQMLQFAQCMRPQDMVRNPLEKRGWILTFEDDFDTGSIDYNKWQDLPYYAAVRYDDTGLATGNMPISYMSPTNFSFGPTTVKLITDNQPIVITNDPHFNGPFTIPYTTAYLGWKGSTTGQPYGPFDQLHGYFEIRCKIPSTPAQWPAFWLVSRASWPPEIDIFEFFTTTFTDRFSSTQHWGKEPDHPMEGANHRVCRPAEYFHIYACEWTATEIRWYYDNQLVRIASDGISDFVYHMHIVVNSAIQQGKGIHPENSTYPNYLEVDYVRAYRR